MHHADVAIYLPFSSGLYSRGFGRAGGAERQMALLAVALASRGVRVAHVVYPVSDPVEGLPPKLRLVQRARYSGDRRVVGGLTEAFHILRSVDRADGRVVVVRTGTPAVGLLALYCRLRRRRLVFSAANDSDFMEEHQHPRALRRVLYQLGVRLADTVVVQSHDQLEIARRVFPSLDRFTCVPSLAEAAPPSPGPTADSGFLWVGRLRDHKQPLLFVDLAQQLPDTPFRLVGTIDGERGEEGWRLRAALTEAAARLPNFELLKPLPHDQLGELIGQSLAVVSTSNLEGMPNIFLEAWSRGVPVLTLNIDPDGVVAQRGLGISAGGDWETLVAGARSLAAGELDRAAVAERTRAYVEETHSLDTVASRWEAIIEGLQ